MIHFVLMYYLCISLLNVIEIYSLLHTLQFQEILREYSKNMIE